MSGTSEDMKHNEDTAKINNSSPVASNLTSSLRRSKRSLTLSATKSSKSWLVSRRERKQDDGLSVKSEAAKPNSHVPTEKDLRIFPSKEKSTNRPQNGDKINYEKKGHRKTTYPKSSAKRIFGKRSNRKSSAQIVYKRNSVGSNGCTNHIQSCDSRSSPFQSSDKLDNKLDTSNSCEDTTKPPELHNGSELPEDKTSTPHNINGNDESSPQGNTHVSSVHNHTEVPSSKDEGSSEASTDLEDQRHQKQDFTVPKNVKIIKKGDTVIKSYVDEATGKISAFESGLRLEVKDYGAEKWYSAKVIEVDHDEKEVLVHYEKWSTRFDEWIKMDSNRIRPSVNTNIIRVEFFVGENVEANWNGVRYPGTIQHVYPNDDCDVLFEDGIKCRKKNSQIFKVKQKSRSRHAASRHKNLPDLIKISDDFRISENDSQMHSESQASNQPDQFSSNESYTSSPASSVHSKEAPGQSQSASRTHYSMFDPPPENLGKRKRTIHNYSLLLKGPPRIHGNDDQDSTSCESKKRKLSISKSTPEVSISEPKRVQKRKKVPDKSSEAEDLQPKCENSLIVSDEIENETEDHKSKKEGIPERHTAEDKDEATNSYSKPDTPQFKKPNQVSMCEKEASAEPTTSTTNSILDVPAKRNRKPSFRRIIADQSNEFYHSERRKSGASSRKASQTKSAQKETIQISSVEDSAPASMKSIVSDSQNANIEYIDASDKVNDNVTTSPLAAKDVNRESSQSFLNGKKILETLTSDLEMKQSSISDTKADENSTDVMNKIAADDTSPETIEDRKNKLCANNIRKRNFEGRKFNSASSHLGKRRFVRKVNHKWYKNRLSKKRLLKRRIIVSSDEEDPACKSSTTEQNSTLNLQDQNEGNSEVPKQSDIPSKSLVNNRFRQHNQRISKYIKNLKHKDGRILKRKFNWRHDPNRLAKPKYNLLSGLSKNRLSKAKKHLLNVGIRRKLKSIPKFRDVKVDIINCICDRKDEFGLMVQCELCLCWQHGNCFGMDEDSKLPAFYVCHSCRRPKTVRKSSQYESSLHEFHKQGRLPTLSVGPYQEVDPTTTLIQCNQLKRRLMEISDLVKNSNYKTKIAFSDPVHPKVYQFDEEKDSPWKEIKALKFQKYYKPILRRLLLHHRNDQEYKDKLRRRIQMKVESQFFDSENDEIIATLNRPQSTVTSSDMQDFSNINPYQTQLEFSEIRRKYSSEAQPVVQVDDNLRDDNAQSASEVEMEVIDSEPEGTGKLDSVSKMLECAIELYSRRSKLNGKMKPYSLSDAKTSDQTSLQQICLEYISLNTSLFKQGNEVSANDASKESNIFVCGEAETTDSLLSPTDKPDSLTENFTDTKTAESVSTQSEGIIDIKQKDSAEKIISKVQDKEHSSPHNMQQCIKLGDQENENIELIDSLASFPLNAEDVSKVLGEDTESNGNNRCIADSESNIIGMSDQDTDVPSEIECLKSKNVLPAIQKSQDKSNDSSHDDFKDFDVADKTNENQVSADDFMETIDNLVSDADLKDSDLILNVFDDFCSDRRVSPSSQPITHHEVRERNNYTDSQPSTSSAMQAPKVPELKKLTAEGCQRNFSKSIYQQQSLIDLYLDEVEAQVAALEQRRGIDDDPEDGSQENADVILERLIMNKLSILAELSQEVGYDDSRENVMKRKPNGHSESDKVSADETEDEETDEETSSAEEIDVLNDEDSDDMFDYDDQTDKDFEVSFN